MKKIILILFVCLQARSSNINILWVQPTQVCPGDTLSIWFTCSDLNGTSNFCLGGNNMNQIWACNNNTFVTLPKALVGNDTIYMIKFQIPPFFNTGFASISPDWVNKTPLFIGCETTGLESNYPDRPKPIYVEVYGNILVDQYKRKVIILPE